MGKKGLLVVTSLLKVITSLLEAQKYGLKTLYVHLAQFQTTKPLQAPLFANAITKIYTSSAENDNQLDVRVLISNLKETNVKSTKRPIDVLMLDCMLPDCETNALMEGYLVSNVINLDNKNYDRENLEKPTSTNCQMYDNVVLGGTFDRLHTGHKILLSEAALRANKRLVVGVTTEKMLKSKILPELIKPVEERIREVTEFLEDVDNTLNYEVVPIDDPFGPTGHDPNLQLLVVSQETLKGGNIVNELRFSKNLNQLEIRCIDLVEFNPAHTEHESKVSSSNQRMNLLGSRLREPTPRPNLPQKPYIIGLFGGIAAGKSIMSQRFAKKGADVIDCDKLAHELYEPGEVCYKALIDHFGNIILDDNKQIDRKKLGQIVFTDHSKLEELNSIVWPALLVAAKQRIEKIYKEKQSSVIFLEAAILLKAGWQTECHEVWSCIIPEKEAIQRLIKRNNLSEQEAKNRISAQIDNFTIVNHSNVVFSSLWSYEYTQLQADKAWKLLQEHLQSQETIIEGKL